MRSVQDEPPSTVSTVEIETAHATASAFMMYTDLGSVPGVYAVLRAKKEWGWRVTWTYMDGSEVEIKILQRKPKAIIH